MDKKMLTLDDFCNLAKKVMPEGSQVWLYGSRARGDTRDDSDWDLLILLDKTSVTSADEDQYA